MMGPTIPQCSLCKGMMAKKGVREIKDATYTLYECISCRRTIARYER
ncbi:MAG: hypothetical protein ABIH34_00205 [Nanoarchaeota archaeon]